MISLLPAEEVEIAAVRAAVTETAFNAWFDQSAIKARVKKACMERQRLRCCYCRKFKDTTNNNEWDLEHILCKLWYPQFFASPANLAIACKQCNIAKSETDVLQPQPRPDPRLTAVPDGSASYAIPHPWIDDWHAHLSHVNYQIYSGGTEKGLELMKLCKLNRTAVEEGGLNYDSVVAAIKVRFFELIDNPVDPTLADAEIVARVARVNDGMLELQTQARLAALGRTLAKQGRAASRRSPDDAIAEVTAMVAKKTRSSVPDSYAGLGDIVARARDGAAAPALPAPMIALPSPEEPEAAD
jgi:hypothetical protein